MKFHEKSKKSEKKITKYRFSQRKKKKKKIFHDKSFSTSILRIITKFQQNWSKTKKKFKFGSAPLTNSYREGNCKFSRICMVDNFMAHIRNGSEANPIKVLDELREKEYYAPKGQSTYSYSNY